MNSWHESQSQTDPPIWFFAWVDPFGFEDARACFGNPHYKENDPTRTPSGIEWCWKFVRADGEELHVRVNEPAGLTRLFSKSNQGISVTELPKEIQDLELQYLESPKPL